jgi:hypothetical protein
VGFRGSHVFGWLTTQADSGREGKTWVLLTPRTGIGLRGKEPCGLVHETKE